MVLVVSHRGMRCKVEDQKKGEPHYGSHAWPSLNGSIMTVVEDDRVNVLLEKLKALDLEKEALGLRAFVLPVEQAI